MTNEFYCCKSGLCTVATHHGNDSSGEVMGPYVQLQKNSGDKVAGVSVSDFKVDLADASRNARVLGDSKETRSTGDVTSSASDTMSDVESLSSKPFAFKGIILSMVSSVFFTLTAVIVKYLKDVHPGQTASFRFLGILLFTIPMVLTAQVNPFGPKDKRHFLILRGLAGATSLYFRYSALHYLPIANATIIVLSMPVFVCIFARIFLKEACGLFHVVAIGVTLLGIGFTADLPSLVGLNDTNDVDRAAHLIGLGFSLGATLVGSFAYVFVRLVKDVHHSVILLNFSVVALIETSIITTALDGFRFENAGLAPWLLVALAILSFYAQLLLTKALQVEEASLVAVTRASMEVVCAFIFQIAIFRQLPDWTAFVGAALVSSAVLLTAARKWVIGLPEGHRAKKVLWFTTK